MSFKKKVDDFCKTLLIVYDIDKCSINVERYRGREEKKMTFKGNTNEFCLIRSEKERRNEYLSFQKCELQKSLVA